MSDILITEWGQVEDRIRELEAQIAALTAERDRYRDALVEYADPLNWMARDYDGEERNWIGPHEGLILAAVALAGRTEGEAK